MDCRMKWLVVLHPAFASEFLGFDEDVQNEMAASSRLLAEFAPHLKRPHSDTLKGSAFGNMKELRWTEQEAYGGQPMRSIRNEAQFCCAPATNPGRGRPGFTSD
jgi:hypothetical protein